MYWNITSELCVIFVSMSSLNEHSNFIPKIAFAFLLFSQKKYSVFFSVGSSSKSSSISILGNVSREGLPLKISI